MTNKHATPWPVPISSNSSAILINPPGDWLHFSQQEFNPHQTRLREMVPVPRLPQQHPPLRHREPRPSGRRSVNKETFNMWDYPEQDGTVPSESLSAWTVDFDTKEYTITYGDKQ